MMNISRLHYILRNPFDEHCCFSSIVFSHELVGQNVVIHPFYPPSSMDVSDRILISTKNPSTKITSNPFPPKSEKKKTKQRSKV